MAKTNGEKKMPVSTKYEFGSRPADLARAAFSATFGKGVKFSSGS